MEHETDSLRNHQALRLTAMVAGTALVHCLSAGVMAGIAEPLPLLKVSDNHHFRATITTFS
jgi:hypothetical protein